MGPKNIEAFYPLSPMQQGMLFHTLLAPESGIYFQQWNCKLRGNLNAGVLQQAWQEVVQRHAVLRTFFVGQDLKEPVQIVRQHVQLPWLSLDWRALAPELQQQQLAEFLAADLARGFDLQHAPLMRLALIQVADETYHFVWSFHHLLLDGWSTPLVIKEVFTFYEGISQGRRVELGAAQPYREYIRWLRGQQMGAAEQFWRELLKGFSAPTALGLERCASTVEEEQYGGQEVRLTSEATSELQQLARTHQVTLNTVVQGVWALLLSRYSGSEDVVFGATVSGRPASLPGVEEMVGLFINTLPVRVAVKSEAEVGGYLRRLQEQQVEVRQYEYSPLVKVQGWSEVGRDVRLFDTIFVFENTPFEETQSEMYGGLRISEVKYIERNNYALTIVVIPGRNLSLQVWYDGRNYEAATTRRLLEHLRTLLEAIVANAQQGLGELSLLTEAERRQVLWEWNDTSAEYGDSGCMQQLFEAQVRRTPAAVAVRSAAASLTFAELDQRANQLAHLLVELGVGPSAVVGLLLDHSCETLVSILGVLKAGCAYLPLDPSHPPARLAFALGDASAALLLTTHALEERLGTGIAAHLPAMPPVFSMDRDWQRCATQPATVPALAPLSSSSAAYLIYTSGSTGVPKGVVIEHGSLVNYICWAQSVYVPAGSAADCALYSSLAFDLTVTSVFLPLVSGYTVHVYPPQEEGPALLDVLEENRCAVLKLTPSHLELIRERDNRNSRIRCLIVGGEALSRELAQAVSESFGQQVEIYNEYGPTEATVGCMLYRYHPETEERAWVPIGRPAGNTEIYVLDERLEPTAEHVSGELYIGGAGVARGYLGRAELTAERFVPDPFSGRPGGWSGGRLYRTGDRARRLADGNLEYQGRADEQVKYHGYRVELNELRVALSAHAKVRDAVVVLRKDGPGGREQLVGYYVGREAVATEELRQHMEERVLRETAPQWYVHLRRLPLTLNGKVNVGALPAPWLAEGEEKKGSGEPRTEAERQLVAIWREVLGRERVGIEDNFFELGGDSILSIQIIARANRAGLQLLPRQLFQHPTVAGLAAVAGTAAATVSEQGEVEGEAPLTPIQRWFFEQELSVPGHYNQSLLLQPQRRLEAKALEAVVGGLLRQHDGLRLRFAVGRDGQWRQWHAPVSAELVKQSCTVISFGDVAEEELGAAVTAAAEEVQRSLDLERGPLFRVVWLEPGAGQSGRLLLVAHHLVVDGVSWRVLLEDLERGYEQAAGGQAVELGAKTSSYREWAAALVGEAERGLGAAEEQYWRAVAEAAVTQIPGGEIAGGGRVESAQRVEDGLSAERTRQLLQEVPAAYNTQINDVLLAALMLAFTRHNGSRDLLINLEGHGREAVGEGVDVSRTVGWFTSIYPVRLENTWSSGELGSLLKATKESLRHIPRRGIGYGILRYLSAETELVQQLRALPPPSISFNYLGQLSQTIDASSLLELASEFAGAEVDERTRRPHLLDINASVIKDRLRVQWTYDTNTHERSEIESLANLYVTALEDLVEHCLAPGVGGYTPTDFPLIRIEQQQLDNLLGNQKVDDIYPLSPTQEGILFHTVYDPELREYCVQINCTFQGKLDETALQRAWQGVVNKYSVLRTFFVWEDLEGPVQVVRQHIQPPWLLLDWRALAPELQQQQLTEFLAADLARGFDLQHAPLMRLALIRVADETYHFVWSFHHLLLDGWSTPLVIKEVFTFYEGLSQGRAVELGAVRPYRDYIRWLREQDLGAAEQFWREQLKGFSAPTMLGIERGIESGATEERYVEHQVRLTAETTGELQQLARRHQVTLNTVVQGAWALLLSRYSGSDDVVFGTTVSGRPASLAGVEEMVGLFINTLPVRVVVKSEDEVGGYLRRLQEQQVEVRQYEYSPLVEVQGWSEVPKGTPLFESLLVFENYPVGEALEGRSGGLEVRDVTNTERNSYPFALVAVPSEELMVKAIYDGRKYSAKTITRMMEHFEALLQGIVERPNARVAELSLLTEAERRQLLWEWNETRAEYADSGCMQELFEAQVRRTPDAVAVRSAAASLTFAELDQQANQLAHLLVELGVGREAVVGLLLDHSCETVVTILGVLKAGCAYLPLDPSHPPARLAFALGDAAAALLVTTHSLAERLGADIAAGLAAHLPVMPPVFLVDQDWQRCAAQPTTAPALPPLSPSSAAYLIYTSGSTGVPKGVVIEHGSLVNYICWAQTVYVPAGSAADCALYSSLAFDLTVTSVFVPLVSGHTVHVYPPQEEGPALLAVLEENRSAVLKLTPSHLELIRERDNRNSRIRCLIVGGEALSRELAQAVSESFGQQVEIYNEYGPTEATVGCMLYRYNPETEERVWVPIGRPAGNTEIYVLDERLEPTAEHVSGELYIGGAGVARGYLGRAELTAERFVPDPFSGRAGGRLYRTGDRARRLADGNLEYQGRADEQVKYHGYRVELNELRVALSAHAKVRDAVVVLRKDGPGGREQLVGYYVGREAVATEELRQHMEERVLRETAPQWYVHLRRLPLTLNGKVNVGALPAPWLAEGEEKKGSGEPRTEAERQLVGIWREVLGRERVGIEDNFFELGGDSILSIQIIARANRAGLQLLPRQLFQHPTVAGLAAVAGTAAATVSEQGEVEGEAPLTPIQRWFFEQELSVAGHYNQSLLLQPQRRLEAGVLEAAVGGLLRQHDGLRLRFAAGKDGQWRQWHAPLSAELVKQSCTVISLSGVAEEELGAAVTAAAEEVQRSLDLERGPLFRVVWLEPGARQSGRLLLVAHHLVVDGVSWRVLLEDLERGYEQAVGGQAVELGAKTSSYREWAAALVGEAERGLGAAEEQYWRAVAEAAVTQIPGGEIAGGGRVESAQRVEASLSAERTRQLLQEVPAAYNTQINDVLVTALARTLSWWVKNGQRSGERSGQHSENGAEPRRDEVAGVLVELEGHGREEVSGGVDVSRTVGWFTSIYPVVLESVAGEEVGAALKRVKEQLRAVPRRGLGYGVLRYLGSGEVSARLREMERAQVGFNYLGQMDQVVGEERWLAAGAESGGAERDGSGQRVHAVEVSGYVVGGELRLGWEYDGARYERVELERVAERYREELEQLIAHCVSEEAGGFTPSDFPLAAAEESDLEKALAAVQFEERGS